MHTHERHIFGFLICEHSLWSKEEGKKNAFQAFPITYLCSIKIVNVSTTEMLEISYSKFASNAEHKQGSQLKFA